MYQRSRTSWIKHIDFMLIDAIVLQCAFYAAYKIRFSQTSGFGGDPEYRRIGLVMGIIQISASLILNNLGNVLRRGYIRELLSVISLSVFVLAFTALYVYSLHVGERYSRLQMYYTIAIFAAGDYVFRLLWKKYILWRKRKYVSSHRSLLILSDRASAYDIISDIRRNNLEGYNIRGLVLTDREGNESLSQIDDVPIVSDIDNAADYICRQWIDEVIIYLPGADAKSKAFSDACAEMGITVHHVMTLRNVDTNKQFIENIGGHTVLTTAYNYISPVQAFIKRLMDITGGLVGSILTLIIIIILGPVIYLNSPGPIIFKQTRIGKNGKRFTVYKLRSMYLDAEERKKDYMAQNRVTDGMMFKLDFDPRIIGNRILADGTRKTGIGEFIRKTSLDEFPQFFNVLAGDMSLVGTRPPTEDEWEKYEYHHRARLAIKPGITGMWQASGRSEIRDFEEVVRLDTEYICNFSIALDIKLLFKTVAVLFTGKGAM